MTQEEKPPAGKSQTLEIKGDAKNVIVQDGEGNVVKINKGRRNTVVVAASGCAVTFIRFGSAGVLVAGLGVLLWRLGSGPSVTPEQTAAIVEFFGPTSTANPIYSAVEWKPPVTAWRIRDVDDAQAPALAELMKQDEDLARKGEAAGRAITEFRTKNAFELRELERHRQLAAQGLESGTLPPDLQLVDESLRRLVIDVTAANAARENAHKRLEKALMAANYSLTGRPDSKLPGPCAQEAKDVSLTLTLPGGQKQPAILTLERCAITQRPTPLYGQWVVVNAKPGKERHLFQDYMAWTPFKRVFGHDKGT